MKNFAIKYPFATGLIVFFTVFIGGTIAGIIVSFVLLAVSNSGKPPVDSHGTNIIIPIIFFLVSLILGVVAGLSTFITFVESEEEKNYK